MKLTKKERFQYGLSAVFAIILLLVGRERIGELLHGPDVRRVSVGQLLEIKKSIPLHNGDTQVGELNTYDKFVITGVDEYFRSSSSAADLIAYYSRALPSLGWVLEGSAGAQTDMKMKFCKSGISIIIDLTTDGTGTSYYMGIGWTKYRQSTTYCPQ